MQSVCLIPVCNRIGVPKLFFQQCAVDRVEVVGDSRMMAKLSSLVDNTPHPMQDTPSATGCFTPVGGEVHNQPGKTLKTCAIYKYTVQ